LKAKNTSWIDLESSLEGKFKKAKKVNLRGKKLLYLVSPERIHNALLSQKKGEFLPWIFPLVVSVSGK